MGILKSYFSKNFECCKPKSLFLKYFALFLCRVLTNSSLNNIFGGNVIIRLLCCTHYPFFVDCNVNKWKLQYRGGGGVVEEWSINLDKENGVRKTFFLSLNTTLVPFSFLFYQEAYCY